MMSRVVASLLLFLCLSGTMVLSMGVSSGFDDSPAELSFAMAELSSSVQDTATAQDTFNSELDEVNENEVDAASEGITNAEIFAELQSKHRHADAAPGKRTPGVHCDQRADCSSCLTLSSCLWNSNTKKCSAVTDVGRMSRRAQWQYISTCDPNATPTQQHTDRRDRSHVAQAHKHVRLDKRKFTPITALVEMESHQVEKKVPEMSMQLFMDETPSMAVEAAVEGEDVNTVMDRSLLSTEASALTSHEQTMAAAHGVVAAAEHAQLSKLQAMKATIAKKKSAVNDEFHRTTSGAPAGISKTAGVDVWEVQSERNAETSPLGFPIGVVPESSRLVIERYAFVNRKSEGVNVKALYGYGYVAGNAGTYGGWAGYNSCGWFALQNKDEEAPIRGKKVSSRQNHPHKCPTEPALNPSKVLKKGTYLKPSVGAYSKLAATLVTSTCSTFLNYDPSTGLASGPSPTIQAGTYSGSKKTFGTVPVVDGVGATNKVKGFGVRYVTADGKYALINYPFLAPTRGEGNRYYFVDANCVKFDQEGVKAVKASVQ